jgi:hypothetical protein
VSTSPVGATEVTMPPGDGTGSGATAASGGAGDGSPGEAAGADAGCGRAQALTQKTALAATKTTKRRAN